jgi:hypothetical protein
MANVWRVWPNDKYRASLHRWSPTWWYTQIVLGPLYFELSTLGRFIIAFRKHTITNNVSKDTKGQFFPRYARV